jgi:hypothetical protein
MLSLRALNRATLERQLLLRRSELPVLDAVEQLVGLEAQILLNPYTLWSRLEGFRPESLSRLLLERKVVRILVMRATIHLVSAGDCLLLRPLMQPVIDAELARHSEHSPALRELDLTPVLEFARRRLTEQPSTGTELRAAIAASFPGLDATAVAYACRNLLPLVQVPPRACGVSRRRSGRRRPKPGSVGRLRRSRPSTRSSCATSAPSGPRSPRTSARGRA